MHMYACMHVWMHGCIYVYIYIYTHTGTYLCIYIYTYAYIYIYIYIHIYIHIYICFTSCSSTSACLGMHISINNPLHIHCVIAHPHADVLKHEVTHIYAYLCICNWIYVCEDNFCRGIPADAAARGNQILHNWRRVRGSGLRVAPDRRNGRRNQGWKAPRSSGSSKLST